MDPVASQLSPIPVVLRSSVKIPQGAGTTVPAVFDTTKFQNTLRVPIEITEFLITATAPYVINSVKVLNEHIGSAVEVELRVKDRHMTNGYVPFRVLAPWNVGDDESIIVAPFDAGPNAIAINQRRVRLPTPLRLLPGVGFSGSARRSIPAGYATTNVTVDEVVSVAAIGRVVPDGVRVPTVQRIPLWTSAKILTLAGTVGSSTELELLNPLSIDFDSDVLVTSVDAVDGDRVGVGSSSAAYDPKISLRWPNGDLLGPDTPPMLQSLGAHDWAIRSRVVVPPRARVHAIVDATDVALVGGSPAMLTQIAMFGSRPEVL